MSMLLIDGKCDPAFAGVRDVFSQHFADGLEIGARVSVIVDGTVVADLWGGHTDQDRTKPWTDSTLVNVWSSTKGVVALAAHVLAERGLLDFDAPVARYWPEFAAAGKEELPVRYLLSHRAGLAGFSDPTTEEDLLDWELVTSRLAAMSPWWEPGTVSGYHAMTYGYLVGEVIRRVSGKSAGQFIRDELTLPLGADFHVGLAPEDDARVATLVQPELAMTSELAAVLAQLEPVALATLANPRLTAGSANNVGWRRAEIPAANGHGHALSLAQLYGVFAGGTGILSAEQVEIARTGQGPCLDKVLGVAVGRPTEFGLGVLLSGTVGDYGPNPRAFGFDGFGGSFGLADPEARLSVGYTMNLMGHNVFNDPRKVALVDAVYAAL